MNRAEIVVGVMALIIWAFVYTWVYQLDEPNKESVKEWVNDYENYSDCTTVQSSNNR